MTILVSRDSRLFGERLTIVRNILHAWRYGKSRDPCVIASRRNVNLSSGKVEVILNKLREEQFIGSEEQGYAGPFDGLTDKGVALIKARVGRPLPKQEGRQVLEKLLSSCEHINSHSDISFYVNTVWLFGSMIDPSKTHVGDVDVAIETKPADECFARKELEELLAFELGCPRNRDSEKWIRDRLLYGPRRHPALSDVDLAQLQRLASPCQLVFDRGRGRVTGAILPKHPAATERSSTIFTVRTLLELG